MVNVALNKMLFYALADALHLPMLVNKGKVEGGKRHHVKIGPGVEYMFPVEVVDGCYDQSVAGILVQGPGDLQIVAFAEYQGNTIITHLLFCDKAKLSPVTAFPNNTSLLTLQNLQAIYGPSVALHCSRANIASKHEDWTIHQ